MDRDKNNTVIGMPRNYYEVLVARCLRAYFKDVDPDLEHFKDPDDEERRLVLGVLKGEIELTNEPSPYDD